VGTNPQTFMTKRAFDIIFSVLILLLFFPLFFLIAILIKSASKGPVFFTQTRLGKDGKPFKIYKFRTMRAGAAANSDHLTLADDKRITKIGRLLRRFKLDELPQFVNVLKGEMSVVGPRPDVPEYYDLTNKLHKQILSVRPGITCFAGIEYSLSHKQESEILAKTDLPEKLYRDKIFPAKMVLNMKYVEEKSFWLDVKLILQTLGYLLKKLV